MREHISSDILKKSLSIKQKTIIILETELTALQEKNCVIKLKKQIEE